MKSKREDIHGLRVCVDCAYCAANGTPEQHEEDWPRLFAAAVERNSDYVLVLTCCGEEEECYGFSRSRCDYCHSTLAGDRHTAALLAY